MPIEEQSSQESMQRYHGSSSCYLTRIYGAEWITPGKEVVNYYCHTHGIVCGAAKWELGWYKGTHSVDLE